jgi:hypothetical protein
MTSTIKQKSSVCIRLSIGQIQLLSRIINSLYNDSYLEEDKSVYSKQRRANLDAIMNKLDAAIERAAGS